MPFYKGEDTKYQFFGEMATYTPIWFLDGSEVVKPFGMVRQESANATIQMLNEYEANTILNQLRSE